jgi:hypothetical protein
VAALFPDQSILTFRISANHQRVLLAEFKNRITVISLLMSLSIARAGAAKLANFAAGTLVSPAQWRGVSN